MAERKQGTVKWFNSEKGYGFIHQQSGNDIFVHANSLANSTNKSLEENDKVEYTVTQGAKGPQASDVKLVR